jgi:phosphatidylserine decarboxylase
MIQLYNRRTGKIEIEKVAQEGFLRFLYSSFPGKFLLAILVKRKIYSSFFGVLCRLSASRKSIGPFVREFGIPTDEIPGSLDDYKSFNDFFIRKLKPGARKFSSPSDRLVAPSDARLSGWQSIGSGANLAIKGIDYSLETLCADRDLAARYENGSCMVFRLAPVDYHRFHFVDSGIPQATRRIKGSYYSVNPIALDRIKGVFGRNSRALTILKSDNFGKVLYVEVGATSVGSIVQTFTLGKPVARGDEKGYFQFGGSTVVLLFEKNKIRIDEDILAHTGSGIESLVKAGDPVGRKN